MSAAPTRYRIAASAFRSSLRLWRAVDDLVADGFTDSQLRVLNSRTALDLMSVRQPCAGEPDQAVGRTQLIDMTSLAQSEPSEPDVQAIADTFLTGREALGRKPESGTLVALPKLGSWINDGDVVLVVSSTNCDQHLQASRILLRHGEGSIRVSEFSRSGCHWPLPGGLGSGAIG